MSVGAVNGSSRHGTIHVTGHTFSILIGSALTHNFLDFLYTDVVEVMRCSED